MKTKQIILALSLVFLAASCGKSSEPNTSSSQNQNQNGQPSQMAPSSIEKNPGATIKVNPPSTTHGYYSDYSEASLEGSKSVVDKIVLFFFSADFAPCKTVDLGLQTNPEKIPPQTMILRVDMKTMPDVAKKYGVIAPLEFVQIDKNDKVLNSWISDDLSLLKKNIK